MKRKDWHFRFNALLLLTNQFCIIYKVDCNNSSVEHVKMVQFIDLYIIKYFAAGNLFRLVFLLTDLKDNYVWLELAEDNTFLCNVGKRSYV